MLINYESFCAAPLATINRVYGQLGVEDLGVCAMPPRGTFHAIPGNPILMDSIGGITADERWRAELGSGELTTFQRIAGRLNARFGYH
ncbi:hypothetical protein GCM10011575_46930 [Microlunatus endophyticus]|uniref:Uncharacterized protein n=2 Tax=Microlunatus endophyticus TaxID=1716077 RepID=A0A917SJV3_9ACTN|nr:hypothetical protein GCM10011575_46930 [Microlunatus endophyticus]